LEEDLLWAAHSLTLQDLSNETFLYSNGDLTYLQFHRRSSTTTQRVPISLSLLIFFGKNRVARLDQRKATGWKRNER
jgi:hypothetical protein